MNSQFAPSIPYRGPYHKETMKQTKDIDWEPLVLSVDMYCSCTQMVTCLTGVGVEVGEGVGEAEGLPQRLPREGVEAPPPLRVHVPGLLGHLHLTVCGEGRGGEGRGRKGRGGEGRGGQGKKGRGGKGRGGEGREGEDRGGEGRGGEGREGEDRG